MVLLRAGYFLAADSAYTDVYQNGLIYGGELRLGGSKIAGWLEGSYRAETGELTYTKEQTEVSVLAVEAGALYRFMTGDLNPYAGAGIGYFMFKEENEAIGQVKQNKIGFCLVGGASYVLGKNFIVDARLKYEFCSMKPADFDIQVGGLTAGIGIGFRW
jgi:opacity protein-like surface antigen